jgi:hypothetical protein
LIILDDKCKKCNYTCNTIYFHHNFKSWTSGNKGIDKFIQETQLSAHNNGKALEWITYDRFCDITYIDNTGIYKANWIDGYIIRWDDNNQNWKRANSMIVILKSLEDTKNVTLKFVNKV